MNKRFLGLVLVCLGSEVFGQSYDSYSEKDKEQSGLLDPARLTIHHSLNFGMQSSSGTSGLMSQSIYSTMMQYQFAAPMTLNLNFGLPIHSTFSASQNLSSENLQSLEYLRTMPFDVSLSWKPLDNLQMRFSVVRHQTSSYYLGERAYPITNSFFPESLPR